ncbi:MAG: class I SAM-dependent methyltransferase [Acidobacteriaceae bacterium]
MTQRTISAPPALIGQCRQPHGWLGRWFLRNMNKRHSPLTDWGLSPVAIPPAGTLLDIGCGGGRTIQKLAAAGPKGKVCGIDHSRDSVASTSRLNAEAMARGQVEVRQGSVSALPWPDATFNLATAVETHFFWPDLPADVREVFRVLAPGGQFIVIAEVYRGSGKAAAQMLEKYGHLSGMTLLTAEEHRALLADAGFTQVQVFEQHDKGWICTIGAKPA